MLEVEWNCGSDNDYFVAGIDREEVSMLSAGNGIVTTGSAWQFMVDENCEEQD